MRLSRVIAILLVLSPAFVVPARGGMCRGTVAVQPGAVEHALHWQARVPEGEGIFRLYRDDGTGGHLVAELPVDGSSATTYRIRDRVPSWLPRVAYQLRFVGLGGDERVLHQVDCEQQPTSWGDAAPAVIAGFDLHAVLRPTLVQPILPDHPRTLSTRLPASSFERAPPVPPPRT